MRALEEKLQYHFKNPALLEEALRHSSYANEHRGANFFSNERLEFLGDSVQALSRRSICSPSTLPHPRAS